MTAFTDRRFEMITDELRPLMQSLKYYASYFAATPQDFIGLFIKPEHIEPLRVAKEICEPNTFTNHQFYSRWRVNTADIGAENPDEVMVQFTYVTRSEHGGFDLLIPRYANKGPLTERSPEAEQFARRIDDYIAFRMKLRADITKAFAVLETLNKICDTPRQVRYFLPGIVALLSANPNTKKQGDALRDYKVPTSIPPTSPEFRDACSATQKLISRALLLPDPNIKGYDLIGRVSLGSFERGTPAIRYPWAKPFFTLDGD